MLLTSQEEKRNCHSPSFLWKNWVSTYKTCHSGFSTTDKNKNGQKATEIGFRDTKMISRGIQEGAVGFHWLLPYLFVDDEEETWIDWPDKEDDDEFDWTLNKHWNCGPLSICLTLLFSFNFLVGSVEVNYFPFTWFYHCRTVSFADSTFSNLK